MTDHPRQDEATHERRDQGAPLDTRPKQPRPVHRRPEEHMPPRDLGEPLLHSQIPAPHPTPVEEQPRAQAEEKRSYRVNVSVFREHSCTIAQTSIPPPGSTPGLSPMAGRESAGTGRRRWPREEAAVSTLRPHIFGLVGTAEVEAAVAAPTGRPRPPEKRHGSSVKHRGVSAPWADDLHRHPPRDQVNEGPHPADRYRPAHRQDREGGKGRGEPKPPHSQHPEHHAPILASHIVRLRGFPHRGAVSPAREDWLPACRSRRALAHFRTSGANSRKPRVKTSCTVSEANFESAQPPTAPNSPPTTSTATQKLAEPRSSRRSELRLGRVW